ncbi:MAG: hypothetical protein Q4E12_07640 [Coriobacteriia bacterium]|nr:hypothetical protein [Coriobacteriia bacterium]
MAHDATYDADFEHYDAFDVDRDELQSQLSKTVIRRRRGEETANRRDQQAWHGTAFVLECVILMLFLTISLAIVSYLFGASHQSGQAANDLTHALVLASTESVNGAEAFAANPTDTSVPEIAYYTEEGGVLTQVPQYLSGVYSVKRTVEQQQTAAGTLYTATIEVVRYEKTVYTLQTESYVSEGRR